MTTVNVNFSFDSNGTRQVKASQVSGINLISTPPALPPVVALSPAAGATLQPAQAVTADVTAPAGASIVRVLISVRFPSSVLGEVIFDGSNFAANYSGSQLDVLTTGYRFTLRRNGGWLDGAKIRVHANTDKGGVN